MHTQPDIKMPRPGASATITLKQTATNNPVITTYHDTIGITGCTRDSPGYYKLTAPTGSFTSAKTVIRPFGAHNGNAIQQISGNVSVGYWTASYNDTNQIDIYTIDNPSTFNQVEMSAITTQELLLEIIVYP